MTPTVDISSSGVILNSGDNINAQITYDGTTLTLTLSDPLLNKTFTYSWPINIPQFVGGNTAYVGFTGGAGGLSASQKLLSWTYVTQALPPVFSVAAGTYTTVQNVTLTSATADAAIYYTTNGTTPNGGSTVYTGPIAVGASETIQAVAISPTRGHQHVGECSLRHPACDDNRNILAEWNSPCGYYAGWHRNLDHHGGAERRFYRQRDPELRRHFKSGGCDRYA